jgi:hypothetical protein
MKLKINVTPKPIEFFIIATVFFLCLFYVIDATAEYFNDDKLYWNYIFNHIFFAQILALIPTCIFVTVKHKKDAKKWLLSLAATFFFVCLSFFNYYVDYSSPATESNYKTDIHYTCIYGEMYSGTLDHENICILRQMPHQDAQFLVHLGFDYTNFGIFDWLDALAFTIGELFIFAGPIYFSLFNKTKPIST